MIHRGEIVEKAIRESGYPITKIAVKLGKSRRHIYNLFENNKIPWDIIEEIGEIIHHDFSKEFKELRNTRTNVVNEDPVLYKAAKQEAKVKEEFETLKQKYIELLEKYNALLDEQLRKQNSPF